MMKNNWGANLKPKRVLKNDEVTKILNQISKYIYLYNFDISINSKFLPSGKFLIKYKVSWDKNGEKVLINNNFSI